jgi:S1-C subfamily serine protease
MRAEVGQARGLIVMGVAKDGPAAQAGVIAGDIFFTIDGRVISRLAVGAATRAGAVVKGLKRQIVEI